MIFVGAGLVPAHNGGKHKALPLQNVNDFLIGINSIFIVWFALWVVCGLCLVIWFINRLFVNNLLL